MSNLLGLTFSCGVNRGFVSFERVALNNLFKSSVEYVAGACLSVLVLEGTGNPHHCGFICLESAVFVDVRECFVFSSSACILARGSCWSWMASVSWPSSCGTSCLQPASSTTRTSGFSCQGMQCS